MTAYGGQGDLTPEQKEAIAAASAASGGGTGGGTGLPNVADPDAAFAKMTRDDYLDYVKDFRGFENELLDKASSDTSLIDQARDDIGTAGTLSAGVNQRNLSRYGAALTPAQQQQQGRSLERANTLGGVQSMNDARIQQKEQNTRLMSDLINIGQGVNRSSLSMMGSAAQDATQRKNAYTQAKAASKAQTMSTIGGLAMLAFMI
jgi:hypothetical protein